MKIALFGGSGVLGSAFRAIFEAGKIEFLAPRSGEVDLLDSLQTREFLRSFSPDFVIFCAGFTAVDAAETERQKCENLNVRALENVLGSGIPIIHFSTDYVFGDSPAGFQIPSNFSRSPLNFYGECKKNAEILIENSGVDFANIRISWLFGNFGENFLTKIFHISKTQKNLQIVSDQIGRPTFAPDAAQAVFEKIICNFALQKNQHFHFQNAGTPVSWAEFAASFLAQIGSKTSVSKISAAEFGAPAARPTNSVFKISSVFDPVRDWEVAVSEFAEKFRTLQKN